MLRGLSGHVPLRRRVRPLWPDLHQTEGLRLHQHRRIGVRRRRRRRARRRAAALSAAAPAVKTQIAQSLREGVGSGSAGLEGSPFAGGWPLGAGLEAGAGLGLGLGLSVLVVSGVSDDLP